MPIFRAKFYNKLLSPSGHPFKVLQRTVEIRQAITSGEALHLAKERFARLEQVPDWRLHAQSVELEVIPHGLTQEGGHVEIDWHAYSAAQRSSC